MLISRSLGNYAYSPGYYSDSLVKCPSDVLVGQTITITCKRQGIIVPCDEYIFAHDTADIQCKPGYEYPTVAGIRTRIECKQNGKWSAPIFECVPACGRVTKKAKALVIHGSETNLSEFPWNVAIYQSNVLVCGGSILSERVVLSAAHCFMKETSLGIERYPVANYEVVAGKYFRDLDASEAQQTQHFKVAKVQIHDAYYGFVGNYDADIAILTLDKPIVYQPHIGPVCLNLDLKTLAEKAVPAHGTIGIVAGYGYTEADGAPSDRLKKIELPIVDIKVCKQESPDNFKSFVTSDKFCAGYNDGRGAVCRGDSGAGYVTGKTIGDETIFFIHGVVSNSRSVNGGCDMNFYAMFTHVQNYIDIIKEEMRLSKIEN
jgi:secreted trypsin-like serine protease